MRTRASYRRARVHARLLAQFRRWLADCPTEVAVELVSGHARAAAHGCGWADAWLRSARGREVCAAVGLDALEVRERALALLMRGDTISRATRYRHAARERETVRCGTTGLELFGRAAA